VAGAETTVLYDLDPATDQLYRQDPPNNGTLVPVGALTLNITGDGGFDIDAKTGTALGLYTVNGNPTLFAVNLGTGAARPLAQYAPSAGYSGVAIPTQPVAYAVSGGSSVNNILYIFNPATPATFVTKPITGLAPGALIRGLDFRPLNGQLYALASGSIYTINAASGAATLVAALSPNVAVGEFDFNPVTDQIRVANNAVNARINPSNGEVTLLTPLNPSGRGISATAYSNNFAGATTTTLYSLGAIFLGNSRTQEYASTIYRHDSPDESSLVTIGSTGSTGIGTIYLGYLDIGGTSNVAYAMLNYTFLTPSVIATVNLETGRVTSSGPLPVQMTGFTVGLGF
jgi:hypothetical protein